MQFTLQESDLEPEPPIELERERVAALVEDMERQILEAEGLAADLRAKVAALTEAQ